ncbi:MAG: hypothetical protein Q4E54_06125 [Lachnospiraceae bacterium]|nr:hypothetical protein [Lachnospiraceae bacterium]
MEPNQDLKAFINSAEQALAELNELNTQTSQLKSEKASLESNVNQQKKKLDDTLNQTYKKRRDEIDKTYDGEIAKCNDKLRRAKAKREKAKNQGIKERISDETAPLRGEIKGIESQINSEIKKNGVPSMCNSGLFFSLFMPGSFKDILIIILLFAVVFFLIPFGVWKLFFDGSTIALFIIYVIDVLVFGGLYITISQSTVMKHHDSLVKIRSQRKEIAEAKKQIDHLADSIKNDSNESQYDLAVFDDEIAHINQQLADITMTKNDAISKFENVTKNILTEQIVSNAKPAIDEATAKLNEVTARLNEVDAARNAKALEISDKYEVYLGREFMTRSKLEELAQIIDHGTVTNISEAKEEYYRQTDI